MASTPTPFPRTRRGLIVEDQADTRAWLVRMLRLAFDGIAISEAATFQAARDWIAAQPRTFAEPDANAARDIALIDIGLPDGNGIDLIRMLADGHPQILPVVTTIYDDDAHLFDAIAAGAKGYLLKDQHADTLVGYLHRIDAGEPPLSPSIAQRMLTHFAKRNAVAPITDAEAVLTPRELDILRLLGRGLRVAEAARVLGLTPHTVAGYVKTVYRKLNISSRAEAAIEAVRRGLV
ncbi:MAG: response regulator transcription factor [Xanthobacteraceae bacterium]